MNLQQLRYLTAFADHGTMTAAARSVPVAQPVLTRALRNLERELGLELFSRDGRGLKLTDDGDRAVRLARRALETLDELVGVNPSPAPNGTRTLVIAATPTVEEMYAGRVADAVQLQPLIRVELITVDDPQVIPDLVRFERADLGLVGMRVPSVGLLDRALKQFAVGLMCPADHDLITPIPVRTVAGLPLIATRRGTVRRERLDAYFEPFGLTANVVLETGDRAAWPSLVRAGHGYALNYIDPDNAPPPGIVLESLEPPVLVEFTAIYRPGMDPAIEQLVDCLVG